MAASIFGNPFGNSTWDGTTLTVNGAVSATTSVAAATTINATAGPITIGGTAGMSLGSGNLTLKPADGGGYLVINNSGTGVAVNSANLLLQSAGTTRAQIAANAADTIALFAANGSSAPTIKVGATAGLSTFGPSAVASLTVAQGVVTAAS